MRRRRNRAAETFGLSFLDAICCGFGAIVLLLVISKTAEPTVIVQRGQGMEALAEELASRAAQLQAEQQRLSAALAQQRETLQGAQQKVAAVAPAAAEARAAREAAALEAEAAAVIEERLATARQELTAEMERLYAAGYRGADTEVGGIPVDSQYIVFVIDTSGSMQAYAWPRVLEKLRQTLAIYPEVKGLQVMSDMGQYLFPQYAGRWIPDTPGRRRVILETLASWQPYSNSSPVEGITTAIRAFAAPDKRISIYVFGDEFTGASIQAVVDTVERINPENAQGEPLVRIHGIGFPTQYTAQGVGHTGIRFATLMRSLTQANGGAFVGLSAMR